MAWAGRLDSTGNFPGGSGAMAEAVMKIAPSVDVEALQIIAANWTSRAKEISSDALSSLHSSSWDPLGTPVVGTSGPIARAAGQVYHTSLAFRKELQAEQSSVVKTFEKRLATYEALSDKAKGCLTKAEAHHKICQDKASTLTQTSESLRAAAKSVQALLEAHGKIEEAREAAEKARFEVASKEKEMFVEQINKRREEIESNSKEAEQKLMMEYKKDDTQGFV